MVICGDLKVCVSGRVRSYQHSKHLPTTLLHFPPYPYPYTYTYPPPSSSKVDFSGFSTGGSSLSNIKGKWPRMELDSYSLRCNSKRLGLSGDFNLAADAISQETENFLLNAINLSFFERLTLAWKIIFLTPASKQSSNANLAKQRLRMILFSDRCAVSDEAKEKIVSNIVNVLSDFVEIESQDKVQLNVSTDADLGTIYSVTVPVRRVKSEYQVDDESGSIMNVEYKDVGETSGNSVDVKFDFYLPERFSDYGM